VIDLTGVKEIDQTESPYYQAFKRMEDNKPPHPVELLEKLGAYIGLGWSKQPKPNFRGWFGTVGGRFDVSNWEAIPSGVDLNDISYIGIWRGVSANREKPIIYCALPSMTNGCAVPGEAVEVGRERIRIGWNQEDLDVMVRHGYEIMMSLISGYGEYKADAE
jgi:hypothetical protein